MTTPFDAPDWRKMSREELDLGLNNTVAVAGSVEMVAGWEQRSAEMRKRFGEGHIFAKGHQMEFVVDRDLASTWAKNVQGVVK